MGRKQSKHLGGLSKNNIPASIFSSLPQPYFSSSPAPAQPPLHPLLCIQRFSSWMGSALSLAQERKSVLLFTSTITVNGGGERWEQVLWGKSTEKAIHGEGLSLVTPYIA